MNQFDKELFLSLCHAYDVELSNTAKETMLIEGFVQLQKKILRMSLQI